MNTMPCGMFIQGASFLHLMNPVFKVLSFFALTAAAIACSSIAGYILMLLLTLFIALKSGLEHQQLLGSVFRMRWFFITILLMNCCFFSSSEAWFSFWIISPSASGLMQGINVCVRVILILIYSNILMGTTAPMAMTDALERLIYPFSYIGLPTAQIAMIISVAIQFIPVLFEETDMIKKAQTARGAGFDSTEFKERAAAVFSLALPVFLAAFRRADELSMAMEARGYRCEKKGRRKKALKITSHDISALLLCCILFLLQLLIL